MDVFCLFFIYRFALSLLAIHERSIWLCWHAGPVALSSNRWLCRCREVLTYIKAHMFIYAHIVMHAHTVLQDLFFSFRRRLAYALTHERTYLHSCAHLWFALSYNQRPFFLLPAVERWSLECYFYTHKRTRALIFRTFWCLHTHSVDGACCFIISVWCVCHLAAKCSDNDSFTFEQVRYPAPLYLTRTHLCTHARARAHSVAGLY